MAIPTSRAKKPAKITINISKCNGCGLCVSVCKDFNFIIENKKAKLSNTPLFGCVACGHCMAVCPTGAIEIHGRELSPGELFDLPPKSGTAGYNQLFALLQRRRSIREFLDKEVEPEIIDKIIEAAKTAPMGLPPSDVNVLIFDTKTKNRAFAKDFSHFLAGIKWMASNWFPALMHPFWGKANDEVFRGFIKPLFKVYTEKMEEGENFINYDAPVALYFYGSPYSDPADPIVAATYAMIAAESLGLGTCMLGGIHPFLQHGQRAKNFREKYRIRYKSRDGLFLIIGYPAVKYKKGIERTFASVTTLN